MKFKNFFTKLIKSLFSIPCYFSLFAFSFAHAEMLKFRDAVASGYVDYIFAQAYNSGGWTIHGFEESNVEFFSAISNALNNSVYSSCSLPASTLCIPNSVKIAIGLPSNAGASGTTNNIFASNGQSPYSQSEILTKLNDEISESLKNNAHIAGVMQWSLNNDYFPTGWNDTFARAGAFSTKIFGAPPSPQLPYFILQVTNTGPNVPGSSAYATVTWGTMTSAQNPNTPSVFDSSSLDNLFSNSQSSFTTDKIIINGFQF